MFKTAATKIAHNSTLPSLGGNKDLRPLQDLINAEKSVLISLQKISVDFGRAAEALRIWGSGEGEDLLDILSASTNLLNQFSTSISNYASHEHAIRDHMKAIRSREEALDELKRRRKGLISKADAAEKKLSKMSPEHKNLGMQTDTLNRLRDEIRSMDSEIMTDEASLGDFKRFKAKSWMGLKFGGLLECCEKGTIIGEFGRLVIGEISEETTQPGMSRTMYMNHQKVSSLISDATRCVDEVSFSTVAAPGAGPPGPKSPTDYLGPPHGIGTGHFLNASEMSTNSVPPSPMSPHTYSMYPELDSRTRSTDDFGVVGPSSPISSSGGASRFATFPVKTSTGATGFSLRDGPAPSVAVNPEAGDDSFSSSVAAALNARKPSVDEPAPSYETHQGPPPGAAAPLIMPSPWDNVMPHSNSGQGLGVDANNGQRAVSTYGDDVGLAYMTNPDDDHNHHEEREEEANSGGHVRQSSKEVHFGQVQDIDSEMDKRHDAAVEAGTAHLDSPLGPTAARTSPKRIPPPSMHPEDEERALNAAAAREVSREMDVLSFSPPPASATLPPRVEISGSGSGIQQEGGTGTEWRSSYESGMSNRTPSPLLPPIAPFAAQRGVSPTPIDTTTSTNDYSDKPTSPTAATTSPVHPNNSPPRMTLPERTISSISNGSNYRTPPEYPRSIGGSPMGQQSTSSLTSGMGIPASPVVPGAGARTISAAAFRRPAAAPGRSQSNDFGSGRSSSPLASASAPMADVSPLQPKKRGGLPNTPNVPSPYGHSSLSQSIPPVLAEHNNLDPSYGDNRVSQASDDYDYLSAYTYSDPAPAPTGSPQRNDYGSLGQIRVANAEMGSGSGPASPTGTPPSYTYTDGQGRGNGGYGEGKFATDLEGGLR